MAYALTYQTATGTKVRTKALPVATATDAAAALVHQQQLQAAIQASGRADYLRNIALLSQ